MSANRVVEKVCPLVVQHRGSALRLLSFEHPEAGKQLVKGTIEPGESPDDAATRELLEESGLRTMAAPKALAQTTALPDADAWHFYLCQVKGQIPESWRHDTIDDGGHTFSFFWHDLAQPLDDSWHPLFHLVIAFVRPLLQDWVEQNTGMGD